MSVPTRMVDIERVVDLLRSSHAPEVIRDYAQAMRNGERFPPISVFPFAKRFFITDGHKRFNACISLHLEEIEVEVWTIGRLLGDLRRQLLRHLRAAWKAVSHFHRGPEGRRELYNFVVGTVAHWKRMVLSFWALLRRS